MQHIIVKLPLIIIVNIIHEKKNNSLNPYMLTDPYFPYISRLLQITLGTVAKN